MDTVLRLTETNQDAMDGFGMLAENDGFAEAAGCRRDDLETALEARRERRAEREA